MTEFDPQKFVSDPKDRVWGERSSIWRWVMDYCARYYDRVFKGQVADQRDDIVAKVFLRVWGRIQRGGSFDSFEGFQRYLRVNIYLDKQKAAELAAEWASIVVELDDASHPDQLSVGPEHEQRESAAEGAERAHAEFRAVREKVVGVVLFFQTEVNEGRWRSLWLTFSAGEKAKRKISNGELIRAALSLFGPGPQAHWGRVNEPQLRQAWHHGLDRFLKFWNASIPGVVGVLTAEGLDNAFEASRAWHQEYACGGEHGFAD